jgi:hypothetical protein
VLVVVVASVCPARKAIEHDDEDEDDKEATASSEPGFPRYPACDITPEINPPPAAP